MEYIIRHQVRIETKLHTKYVRIGADRHLSLVLTPTQATRYASKEAAAADVARYGISQLACIIDAPAPAPAPARKLAGTSGPLWSGEPERA